MMADRRTYKILHERGLGSDTLHVSRREDGTLWLDFGGFTERDGFALTPKMLADWQTMLDGE